MSLSDVPPGLKVIRAYVKIALELYKTKPVISYHCFSYAMRIGLKTNYKGDPEAKAYLFKLMDHVEAMQNALCQNEELADSVRNDMDGQMAVENAACEYFEWADGQDRAGNIDRRVMKAFYTSHLLYCVLQIFNEPTSETNIAQQKYAAWKSTYIKKCFMTGETPIPGPMKSEDDPEEEESGEASAAASSSSQQPTTFDQPAAPSFSLPEPYDPPRLPKPNDQPQLPEPYDPPRLPRPNDQPQLPEPYDPPRLPRAAPRIQAVHQPEPEWESSEADSATLSYALMAEAQKLCKFGGSALSYDDTKNAIVYLEKCLKILKTGKN